MSCTSWPESDGKSWNFCILPNTNRNKEVKEVFDEGNTLRNIEELRRKFSSFPLGTRIVWFDRLTWGRRKVQGSERLQYPPLNVVRDIRAEASKRGIDIDGPDAMVQHCTPKVIKDGAWPKNSNHWVLKGEKSSQMFD